ncbi:MAG: hypothetical protein ACOY4I_13385 [Bacillota bacterium]
MAGVSSPAGAFAREAMAGLERARSEGGRGAHREGASVHPGLQTSPETVRTGRTGREGSGETGLTRP